MKSMELKARAKINLTLDVLRKRADGYHEVEMVMQTIDLHDDVVLQETAGGIEVTTDNPQLAGGESNIAHRAAGLIIESFGIKKGIRIHIKKKIPLAAGLAGGSTDAAAVLGGLNIIWDLGMSREETAAGGAMIGSDVPFCVVGGTALARGRGEILSRLPPAPDMWIVLVKPPIGVSTAEVYRNFNPASVSKRPRTGEMVAALGGGDVKGIIANLANVLETVTLQKHPEVYRVKQAMEGLGVERPLMSGSGPTVFGIVDSRTEAERIRDMIRAQMPEVFTVVSRTWAPGRQEFSGKA